MLAVGRLHRQAEVCHSAYALSRSGEAEGLLAHIVEYLMACASLLVVVVAERCMRTECRDLSPARRHCREPRKLVCRTPHRPYRPQGRASRRRERRSCTSWRHSIRLARLQCTSVNCTIFSVFFALNPGSALLRCQSCDDEREAEECLYAISFHFGLCFSFVDAKVRKKVVTGKAVLDIKGENRPFATKKPTELHFQRFFR